MSDVDISPTLDSVNETPEEATKDVVVAQDLGVSADTVENTTETKTSPEKPVTRTLANAAAQNPKLAKASTSEISQLDYGTRLSRYMGASVRQSDISRKWSELANEISDLKADNKPIPDELDIEFQLTKEDLDAVGAEMSSLDLGGLSEGLGTIPTVVSDAFKDMLNQWETVVGGTVAGAGLGALGGTAGIPIPLVGTFLGAGGGALTGFAAGALGASAIENFKRARGSAYGELSIAQRNGVNLNIDEETKRAIANGVGIFSSGLELVGEKIGLDKIPVFKRILSGKYISEAVIDPVKLANLKAVGEFMKAVTTSATAEGLTEAAQGIVEEFGDALGRTWDGKETSFADAVNGYVGGIVLNRPATDPDTGEPILDEQGRPVGQRERFLETRAQEFTIGAVASAGLVSAGRVNSYVHDRIEVAIRKGKNKTNQGFDNTQDLPDQDAPVDSSRVPVINNNPTNTPPTQPDAPPLLNPTESITLGLALQSIADSTKVPKAADAPDIDIIEIQRKLLKDSGINNVWVSQNDLNKWANNQAKVDFIRNKFTPGQLADGQLGAKIPVDPEVMLEMIRMDASAAKMARPSVEGLTFTEAIEYQKGVQQRTQKAFTESGLREATDAPVAEASAAAPVTRTPVDTTKLGPHSTDEEIIATLGTREEADAYLGRLAEERVRLETEEAGMVGEPTTTQSSAGSQIPAIDQMIQKVNGLLDQLPDTVVTETNPDGTMRPSEEVEAAFDDYITAPVLTDLVKAGMSPKVAKEFTDRIQKVRQAFINATKDAADKEMTHLRDMVKTMVETEIALENIQKALTDPDVKIVDLFLENREALQIDPSSLTEGQTTTYRKDPVLKKRKVFKKGGRPLSEVAFELGFTDPNDLLNILRETPDSQTLIENIETYAEQEAELESVDSVDINSAAILKVINDKQKMNLREIQELVKTSWNKTRLAIERVVLARLDMTAIRQETFGKVITAKLRTLKPKNYEIASKLARRRSLKAANRGDFLEAARQREIEIKNDEFYKQSLSTIGKANKSIKRIARMLKNPRNLEILRKAGVIDAFMEFSTIVNLDPKRGSVKAGEFAKYVKKALAENQGDFTISQELAATFDPRAQVGDISYEQLKFIEDTMRTMLQKALEFNKLSEGANETYMVQVHSAIAAQLRDHPDKDPAKVEAANQFERSLIKKLQRTWDNVDASLTNINYTLLQLSQNDPTGYLNQVILDQLKGTGAFDNGYGEQAANKMRQRLRNRMIEKLEKFGKKRIDSYGHTWVDGSIDLAASVGLLDKNGKISKLQLMGIVAYYGSKTGRQRLSNYGVSADSLFEFAKKHLVQDDFRFIQEGIHDTFELMRPDIIRVSKDRGRPDVEFVEGESYQVGDETFRGGYIPIRNRYDARTVDVINETQELTESLTDGAPGRSHNFATMDEFTTTGQYKARVEKAEGLLDLDFGRVTAVGFENLVMDLTMGRPIVNVMKLLNDKKIHNEIKSVIGGAKLETLMNHVVDSGKSLFVQRIELFERNQSFWANMLRFITNNVVSNTLLYSGETILMQTASSVTMWADSVYENPLGIISITWDYVATWIRMITSPGKFVQSFDFAKEIVPSIGSSINDATEQLRGGVIDIMPRHQSSSSIIRALGGMSEKYQNLYFTGALQRMDSALKTGAAITLYNRFLKGKIPGWPMSRLEKMSEQERINAAKSYVQSKVEASLTAAGTLDRAAVQKIPAVENWAKYFNDIRNLYNWSTMKVRESKWHFKRGMQKKSVGEFFKAVYPLITLHITAAVTRTLIERVRGRDDEGEDLTPFLKDPVTWIEDLLNIGIKNITDPFAAPKNVAGSGIFVRDILFKWEVDTDQGKLSRVGVQSIDNKAAASIAEGTSAIRLIWMNDGDWTNQERNAVLNMMGALIPRFPYNAIKKEIRYREGETIQQTAVGKVFDLALEGAQIITGFAAEALGMISQITDPVLKAEAQKIYDEKVDPTGAQLAKMYSEGTVKAITNEELDIIRYAESSGNDYAMNQGDPSRAVGPFQITASTWKGLWPRDPRLTKDGRADPEQQRIAMDILVRDNAAALARNKIPVNIDTVYTAHHFGADAAVRILSESDTTKLSDIYVIEGGKRVRFDKSRAVANNPWLRGKVSYVNNGRRPLTVADFKKGIGDLLFNGSTLYYSSLD